LHTKSWRAALIVALGASFLATGALAQQDQRDLQPELIPGHPHHRPVRPMPAPAPMGPVEVSLTPIGPSTIAIGEPLKFRLLSLADGYASLYVLSASGRSQLWLENVRVRAGIPLVYPRAGMLVRAAPPAGDEHVMFVVTRSRISGFLGGGSDATNPIDLQYTHDGLRGALQSQLNATPRGDWAVAEVTVRVAE
jgi:hypothetical protein